MPQDGGQCHKRATSHAIDSRAHNTIDSRFYSIVFCFKAQNIVFLKTMLTQTQMA